MKFILLVQTYRSMVSIEQPVRLYERWKYFLRENKVLVDCVNRTTSQPGCVEDGWVTSRGSTDEALGGTGVSAVASPAVSLARLLVMQPRSVAMALGGAVHSAGTAPGAEARSTGAAPGGEARSWPACPARADGEAYSKAARSGEVRGGGEWSSDSMGLQWGNEGENKKTIMWIFNIVFHS
jgi:hypothetical protein